MIILSKLCLNKEDIKMKKYYSAICLIIRNENEYLQEWIRHHLKLGFEHIYIYDHNCKVPIEHTIKTKLKSYEREYITIINWQGRHTHAQDEAYTNCINFYGKECEWLAFIDTDEFIILHKNKSINDFLKQYDDVGGVYMNWIMYNANNQEHYEHKPVMERFTQQCPDFQQYGKLITKPDRIQKMYIHEASYKKGYHTVDENKNIVIGRRHPYHTKLIQCNHYYTKSWEEWKRKISRGVADPYFGRNLREFFLYNPGMKYLDDGTEQFQEYERNVN